MSTLATVDACVRQWLHPPHARFDNVIGTPESSALLDIVGQVFGIPPSPNAEQKYSIPPRLCLVAASIPSVVGTIHGLAPSVRGENGTHLVD